MNLVTSVLLPIALAILTGSGVVAYFKYRETKPQNEAGAVVTFADGWEKYAGKLEQRLDKAEKHITELRDFYERKIAELTAAYNKNIAEKDERIAVLESRVEVLEHELYKYQQVEGKTEVAREELHTSVDKSLDDIKKKGDEA